MGIIKAVAKSLDLGYKFGTYREINALFDRTDKMDLPVVCELLALKGSFELKYESVRDNQDVCLLFLDLDGKTVDSEKTGAIIDRMKSKALEFIKAINETQRFETIDGTALEYFTIVKQFDKCLSGIEITLNLKPSGFVCYE